MSRDWGANRQAISKLKWSKGEGEREEGAGREAERVRERATEKATERGSGRWSKRRRLLVVETFDTLNRLSCYCRVFRKLKNKPLHTMKRCLWWERTRKRSRRERKAKERGKIEAMARLMPTKAWKGSENKMKFRQRIMLMLRQTLCYFLEHRKGGGKRVGTEACLRLVKGYLNYLQYCSHKKRQWKRQQKAFGGHNSFN